MKKVISVQQQWRSAQDTTSKGRGKGKIPGRREALAGSAEGHPWRPSTMTVAHVRLKGKAAQGPSQTQQPKATENTGQFQRHCWEENHSLQTGISSVNYGWTQRLKTGLSGIQAFKKQCKPRGKSSGAAFLAQNICILSGIQMMKRAREPRVRADLIPPNDYTSLSTGLRTPQAEIRP